MAFRKFIILIITAIVIQVTQISGQQPYNSISPSGKTIIFNDSFDNNSNNWFTDNLWLSGKVNSGYYRVICKNYQKSNGLTYKPVVIDQTKDWEIETSLKNLKGSGGVVFGMNNKYDHYRIEILDNTLFVVKNTISKGKQDVLFSVAINSYLNQGSFNKITIRKLNGSFTVYLNENYIDTFNNIKPEGDQIGFNVGLNSEISVDYLNVCYLGSSATPAITENIPAIKDSMPAKIQESREITSLQSNIKPDILSDDPVITWISPSSAEEIPLDKYSATVKAKIESSTGLSKVSFYVNGVSQGEGEIRPKTGENGVFEVEKLLNFIPGKNAVYILASNEKSDKKSEERFFANPNAMPPVISWVNPASDKISNTERVSIEACIKSEIGLRSVNLLVNGVSLGEDYVFVSSSTPDCNIKWIKSVVLKNGKNSIYIIAQNSAGNSQSENLMIDYQPGIAERRIALVMGNAEYKDKQPLKNPVNDANLMAGNLESLGFRVIKCTNAGKIEMEKALMEFSQMLPSYNVALFYYAGHGIQVDGKNYLIPTDAKLTSKTMCKWEAISLSDVVSEFEKFPDNINIVLLDACRNDPFTDWVRGNEAGFRFITNVSGTIIGYATVEGATAADGSTANGLYTEELIKQMNIPQSIESVFKKTRVQVEIRSNGTQSPRESSGLRGEFYFKK